MGDLQPDIKGFMAATGTEHGPLFACNSHIRSVVYPAIAQLGAVKAELGDPEKLATASARIAQVSQLLADVIRADMIANLPGAMDLSDDDWSIAMRDFYVARSGQFFDPETGQPIVHTHEGAAEPGEAGVSSDDDGLAGVAS